MSAQYLDSESALVKRHVDQLAEHFDTVQILVTRHDHEQDQGKTVNIARGCGNWFARIGQMRSFVIQEDERERIYLHSEEP